MQQTAVGAYYADDGESAADARFRYIGIDRQIPKLAQIRFVQGNAVIDDTLELFTVKKRTHALPFTNKRLLLKRNGIYVRDEFDHEQCLVLKDGDTRVLLSGCAHNGILNILDAYRDKYGGLPDAVISGFHLMVKREYTEEELQEIRHIANTLKQCSSKFYTCHCTGAAAYEEMKNIMGEQLRYVHSGDEFFISRGTDAS